MSAPVLVKRTFLVAAMVVVQTITPPLVAMASLFLVIRAWHVSPHESASAVSVAIILMFVMLIRPPRDLTGQVDWRPLRTIGTAFMQWLLLLSVLTVTGYATGTITMFPPSAVVIWATATPAALMASTLLTHYLMRRVVLSCISGRKVIIAGYNRTSLDLARALESNASLRLRVEGFFDDRAADRLKLDSKSRLLGGLSDLADYAKQHGIDVIYIALPMRHLKRVLDLLDDLRDTTASIYYVPDIFVFDLIQARSGELSGIPVVAMCETPFYGYRGLTKRLIDIFLSTCFLIAASPLLLVIALLVKLTSPGPAIFRQRRYGLDGQEIIVYKFRTMTVTEDGGELRQASRHDKRVTPIGGFLRRFSIDELPQFINVLQGRMSLVGPRPHAVAHNELYRKLIKGYMVRHKVLPGITGLAQVSGARGETAKLEQMEARVRHDLDYLRHWSPMLDIKILLRTAIKIFWDDEAY